jgi:hypothetical protein
MENIVEIIRQEYFSEPVMRHLKHAFNWQVVYSAI